MPTYTVHVCNGSVIKSSTINNCDSHWFVSIRMLRNRIAECNCYINDYLLKFNQLFFCKIGFRRKSFSRKYFGKSLDEPLGRPKSNSGRHSAEMN